VTPRIARAIVIAATAVAVIVAAAGRGDPEARTKEPEPDLELRYLYSPDAEDLLVPLIDRFNLETHRSGGREIRIEGVTLTSGEAEAALAARRDSAVLWTPASSLWGRLLNHGVSAEWVPAESPSLVSSPQVIAMWETLARALGWPKAKIGWKDILALATSSRGWGEYGHPEYGRFRLGHTNPGFSTSGLSAVASEYYAVTGKRSGLSLADVRRPNVRAAVRTIERSIVHYGETAELLTDQMDRYGQAYAHAVYVQETTVERFNAQRRQATPLVKIEPADGTFVADYPLIALDAPWVSADGRAGAQAFRRWLVPKITAKNAAESGFRLRRPTGLVELELPKPEVLAAIRDAWHEDRKPANIVLVVDTSSSMGEAGRLDAAKQGLLSFLRELSPEDRVALVTSGDTVETNVRLGAPSESRSAVSRAVRGLFPNGDAPVYPAVSLALEDVRALDDPDRINAVVVLSDGAGTNVGRNQLLRAIASEPVTEGTSVRIFTVAYGQGADAESLQQIASASGGAFFTGSPKDIKVVYRRISSYF
jgi:Ca-activated chloride channel family protein